MADDFKTCLAWLDRRINDDLVTEQAFDDVVELASKLTTDEMLTEREEQLLDWVRDEVRGDEKDGAKGRI